MWVEILEGGDWLEEVGHWEHIFQEHIFAWLLPVFALLPFHHKVNSLPSTARSTIMLYLTSGPDTMELAMIDWNLWKFELEYVFPTFKLFIVDILSPWQES
jgi:hypothetical protein